MDEYKTKTREYIIEFIMINKNKSFTVKEMYEWIKAEGKSINLTTIYRNLDKMADAGVIVKHMDSKLNEAVYQYLENPEKCVMHLHMECTKCGRVVHLDPITTNSFLKSVQLNSFFSVDVKSTVVFGLCNSCQGKFIRVV